MPKCPICKINYDGRRGALSRRDNKTTICPECGTMEALEDWMTAEGKWPPDELNRKEARKGESHHG